MGSDTVPNVSLFFRTVQSTKIFSVFVSGVRSIKIFAWQRVTLTNNLDQSTHLLRECWDFDSFPAIKDISKHTESKRSWRAKCAYFVFPNVEDARELTAGTPRKVINRSPRPRACLTVKWSKKTILLCGREREKRKKKFRTPLTTEPHPDTGKSGRPSIVRNAANANGLVWRCNWIRVPDPACSCVPAAYGFYGSFGLRAVPCVLLVWKRVRIVRCDTYNMQ